MKKSKGFTLLEVLSGIVIVSIGVSTAIPSFLRQVQQSEVDRYTTQLEAGVFSLRSKLGQQKTSCTLTFPSSGLTSFAPPINMMETQTNPTLLECCDTQIGGCAYSADIPGEVIKQKNLKLDAEKRQPLDQDQILKIKRERSIRLVNNEGSPESRQVEVAVSAKVYELTPPGTSTAGDELMILVRSKNTANEKLRTRCLKISGTSTIYRGSWNEDSLSCKKS